MDSSRFVAVSADPISRGTMDVLPCLWYGRTYFPPMVPQSTEMLLEGLPSAIICMWGSTLANAALFALIFPSVSIRLRGLCHIAERPF